MTDYISTAEASVLGGILHDNSAMHDIVPILKPDDFSYTFNQKIYRVMKEMYERSEYIDMITLDHALSEKNILEDAGGSEYLCELSKVFSIAGIKEHARIIKDESLKRKLTSILNKAKLGIGKENVQSVIKHAEIELSQLQQSGSSRIITIKEGLSDLLKRLSDPDSDSRTVKTGFYDLDDKISCQPSDFIILAARPSMGKTALALNIADNVASSGKKVAFFSLEMSTDQLKTRLLCSRSKTNIKKIKYDLESSLRKLTKAAGDISQLQMVIDDTGGLDISTLRAKAMKIKREFGLDFIVIDYLQYLKGTGRENTREQEIAYISRSLKAMAKELDVPILTLAQLNRECERRNGENKRPIIADLRESGSIEQDADIILFIYRDEIYNSKTADKNKAEIIIAKQRNGSIGIVKLGFEKKYMRFNNLSNQG